MKVFPKAFRLRTRKDYQRIAQGYRKTGDLCLFTYRFDSRCPTRLGITVTKKNGKAHVRNRFKRVIREAFRLCRDALKSGLQLHVRPNRLNEKTTSLDIQKEILCFFSDGIEKKTVLH